MEPNLQEIASGAVGLVLGIAYAVSGFSDSGKIDELSKTQRVKNLLWLFFGGFAVITADWKLISPNDTDPDHLGLFVYYLGGAILAAAGGISVISVMIALTVQARSRRSSAFKGRVLELVLEYISYGYRYYRAQLALLDQQAGTSADVAASLEALGEATAIMMASTTLDRLKPDARQRRIFIDQVLKAMEDTVKLFAPGLPDLELKSNYMARVSVGELGDASPLFTERSVEQYDSFLLLRRYRNGRDYAVCLPIEGPTQMQKVLPGAPYAVAFRAACILNPAKITFERNVSQNVRTEIKDFFKGVDYASVLSVPILWDNKVVGVVNIESNHIDVVGKGSDIIRSIGSAVAPYCFILGELVERDEKHHEEG